MFFFTAGYQFGFVDHGHILPLTCSHCSKVTYWKMYEKKTQVSVYFIPLPPSSKGHVLVCDFCSFSIALTPGQIQRAYWLKQVTQAYFQKKINETQYKENLEQVNYLH